MGSISKTGYIYASFEIRFHDFVLDAFPFNLSVFADDVIHVNCKLQPCRLRAKVE